MASQLTKILYLSFYRFYHQSNCLIKLSIEMFSSAKNGVSIFLRNDSLWFLVSAVATPVLGLSQIHLCLQIDFHGTTANWLRKTKSLQKSNIAVFKSGGLCSAGDNTIMPNYLDQSGQQANWVTSPRIGGVWGQMSRSAVAALPWPAQAAWPDSFMKHVSTDPRLCLNNLSSCFYVHVCVEVN